MILKKTDDISSGENDFDEEDMDMDINCSMNDRSVPNFEFLKM